MGCSPSSARIIGTTGSSPGVATPGPSSSESPSDNEDADIDIQDIDDSPPDYSLIENDIGTIDNVLEFLSNEENLKDNEDERSILGRIMQLDGLYEIGDSAQKHEQFANYLAEHDFATLYVTMHRLWHSIMHDDRQAVEGKLTFWGFVGALETATVLLGNVCDSSAKMCRMVGQAGLVEILIGVLHRMKNYVTQGERDARKDNYLECVLSTLHNSIRLCNDNRGYFRDSGAVNLFQYYLQLDNLLYRTLALLTLSYIIDDEENDTIIAGNKNIEFLVVLLSSAVDADDHRELTHGYHVTELVDGMTKLAVNDVNKVTIVEVGVLPLLVKLLQANCSPEEQRLSATALWSLAFHEDNKDNIRKESGCLKALENLKDEPGENTRLKKACAGALWELKEQEARPQGGSSTGHVMISYNWDVQGRIIKLKKKLKSAGYDVWMDIEKMGGSTLAAMADAVQGADVVLICMSEKYKSSNPCRSEAEYTYKLQRSYIPLRLEKNYSPDGWLGIMAGAKLYFDFSSEEQLETNFSKLVREIGDRGKVKYAVDRKYEVNVTHSGNVSNMPGNMKLSESTISQQDPVSSWEYADVTSWLTRNGIGYLAPKFKKYTGRQLLTLRKICLEAPEFFYSSLKKDLGFKDLYDIALFKEALENID